MNRREFITLLGGEPRAELEQQLEECRRELAEAREHLAEALEQQTATSEVLQVISSSPGELEPVFQAMQLANNLLHSRICRDWRPDVLWTKLFGLVPARGRLRPQNPARREAQ